MQSVNLNLFFMAAFKEPKGEKAYTKLSRCAVDTILGAESRRFRKTKVIGDSEEAKTDSSLRHRTAEHNLPRLRRSAIWSRPLP